MKIPTTWSSKDHKLYLDITLMLNRCRFGMPWKWARHIVNANKYNKENKNETK